MGDHARHGGERKRPEQRAAPPPDITREEIQRTDRQRKPEGAGEAHGAESGQRVPKPSLGEAGGGFLEWRVLVVQAPDALDGGGLPGCPVAPEEIGPPLGVFRSGRDVVRLVVGHAVVVRSEERGHEGKEKQDADERPFES